MGIGQDLGHAARRLGASPLFTLVAALSLAVGIGAATTVFSLVEALLLRDLPGVSGQDRLVTIHRDRADGSTDGLSLPNLRDLAAGQQDLDGIAGFTDRALSLRDGDESRLVLTQLVTGNFFEVLGTRARLGRLFAGDIGATTGDDPVAVISHALWRGRFDADPGIVGREVHLNGRAFTIIGVAEKRFGGTFFGFVYDLWIPASMIGAADPRIDPVSRDRGWLEVIGRLAPGVSRQQAATALAGTARRLERAFPAANDGLALSLDRLTGHDPGLRTPLMAFLAMLLAVTLLVLLMASLNVANMLLARAVGRSKEVAIRLALGIGRWRLVRQMMCESFVLAALGGIAGVVLAFAGIRAVRSFEPPLNLPLVFHVELNGAALLFAFTTLFVAAAATGLVPALKATKPDLVSSLQETAVKGGGRSLLRRGFVVAQVSVSLVLLVVTGLFLRTLQHAAATDPGFRTQDRAVLTLDARIIGLDAAQGAALYREIQRQLEATPGVRSAAIGSGIPLGIGGLLSGNTIGLLPPGYVAGDDGSGLAVEHNTVGAGYLETLDIGVISGRGFQSRDDGDGARVAVVNRALAQRFWPGEAAVGRTLRFEDGGEATVVGLTETGKYRFPGEDPRPFVYLPYQQHPTVRARIVVSHEPGAVPPFSDVRALVRRVSPDLPVLQWESMDQAIAISLLPQRMAAWVAGTLGLVGLVLTMLGVYGVVAHAVSARSREFGLRMCLGASRRRVMADVIGGGVVLTALGTGLGLVLAFGVTRFLGGVVFGVSTLDPVTFVGIPLLLIAVTAIASGLPARRLTGINPADALRSE